MNPDFAEPAVFLGGTCGNNPWRLDFTKKLVELGVDEATLFNPVVENWNSEAQEREEIAKLNCDYLLFYIGDPMTGDGLSAYSMVEATMALYDASTRTVVVFNNTGLTGHYLKAMNQTSTVLRERFPARPIFDNIQEAITWLAERLQ